jgi:hypothetical protein
MIPLNANSLSERKGDLRSRKIARFGLVISLSLVMTIAFQKNDSVAYSQYKTQHYKQYTFIELNDVDEYYCIEQLWHKESRWSPTAKNARSSAYGIPQLLNMKEPNPFRQIDKGLRYIEHRYQGSPCKALQHHKIKGWY